MYLIKKRPHCWFNGDPIFELNALDLNVFFMSISNKANQNVNTLLTDIPNTHVQQHTNTSSNPSFPPLPIRGRICVSILMGQLVMLIQFVEH